MSDCMRPWCGVGGKLCIACAQESDAAAASSAPSNGPRSDPAAASPVPAIRPGVRLLVWPGARLPGIEPRHAVALADPAPFGGGTTCVRVQYMSGHRVGGTDYIAMANVEVAGSEFDALYDEVIDVCTWARESGYPLAYEWIMDRFAQCQNDARLLPTDHLRALSQPDASADKQTNAGPFR